MDKLRHSRLDNLGGFIALLGLGLIARGWSGLHGDAYVPYISGPKNLIWGAVLLIIVAFRSLRRDGGN